MLIFSLNAEENKSPSPKEVREETKALFSPLIDTMRAQQISHLAEIYSNENEEIRKLVPYLIFNLIKDEIDLLEQSSYDDTDLEKMRKETLEKLYESRKKYSEYADITKLLK